MLLLVLLVGVVWFAIILRYLGPKITAGRRYPDERMRLRVASVDFFSMKPRSRFGPREDRSYKKRWEDFMDDEGDY